MIRCYRSIIIITLLLFSAGSVLAQDPGLRDTLRIHAAPLIMGSSNPITISIYNDSAIEGLDFVFELASLDSGFARFDSAHFVGRMSDPTVLPLRIVNTSQVDGLNPDTLLVACLRNVFSGLPPGDGEVAQLYFTPLALGTISIDTATGPSGISLDFIAGSGSFEYAPSFQSVQINVLPGIEPPNISVTEPSPLMVVTGDKVTLNVTGASPAGLPVTVDLVSVTDADSPSRLPVAEAQLQVSDNTGKFSWRPAATDLGVWTATFSAADSLGQLVTITAEVQVVSEVAYLLEFGLISSATAPYVTGLTHGDFDGDQRAEILTTGSAMWNTPSVALYDYFPGAELEKSFEITRDDFARALVPMFLPGDDFLDGVMAYGPFLAVLRGNGQGTFELTTDIAPTPTAIRNGTGTDFDGDQYLDYALVNRGSVIVFRGTDLGSFAQAAAWILSDTGLTINSADLDNDGWDDLAVGTVTGLEVYINDGAGGYIAGEKYEQRFGATDLDITSRGTDFNTDGVYDLCLASPSVGGIHSELVVYFGLGDATFDPSLIRTVQGQINAACPGDFNGDGYLDIAFLNSSRQYLGLLFGDGVGGFLNELRFPTPQYAPRYLDCLDIDLDGDLDIAVSAYDLSQETETGLYLFINQLDPISVVNSDLELVIRGNAEFDLVAPNGGHLNRHTNSLASAELYWRAAEGEQDLHAWVTAPSAQAGSHDLIVTPRPDRNPNEPFTLQFEMQGQKYRIARNQAMNEAGFIFPLDPSGTSGWSPRQGEFIKSALPTFTWESSGVELFELATDLSFANIIESAVVSGGVYTLQMVLPYTDSAAYYWRIAPETGEAVSPIHAFNVVRVPTSVDEPGGTALLPDSCWLAQNYPNPFNPTTTLKYHMAEAGVVSITIHNVLGQLISTLVDGPVSSGTHTVDWDATDLDSRPVASGIYFYRMEFGEFSSTRKMVLVR